MSNETPVQRLTKRIEDVRRDSKESLKDDPYVKLAFQRLDLDLETTEDRTLLMRAFCRVLQGAIPLKPVGFLNDLILDAEKIVQIENLTGGRREAVQRLRTHSHYRQTYGKFSWHTLLKYMTDATNRKKNPDYDELVKGRPIRPMYSRTIFARPFPTSELPPDGLLDSKPAREKKRTGRRSVRKPASIHPQLVWFRGRVYIVESEIT